jgi:hypothetical protein
MASLIELIVDPRERRFAEWSAYDRDITHTPQSTCKKPPTLTEAPLTAKGEVVLRKSGRERVGSA